MNDVCEEVNVRVTRVNCVLIYHLSVRSRGYWLRELSDASSALLFVI